MATRPNVKTDRAPLITDERVWIGLTAIEEAWRRGEFGWIPEANEK